MSFASGRPHPRSIAFALSVFFMMTSRSAPAAEPATPLLSAPADALVMRPQMLRDPYPQMDAVSVLVPARWKLGGQVDWIPGAATCVNIDLAVFDPAQKAAVRLYPIFYFVDGVRENQKRANMQMDPSGRLWAQLEHLYQDGAMNSPGQEIRHQPRTPREYVQTILVPKLRKDITVATDVTVVSEMDLPEYAKAKGNANNPNAKFTASRFRITYTGQEGPVEEEFICTIGAFPIGVGPSAFTLWDAEVSSSRAPKGKLDALLPTFTAIRESVRMQLPYYNFITQIGQMIVQAERDKLQRMIANDAERSRIMNDFRQQANAETSQHIRDNFKKQQDAKGAAHEQFMHYVNDTNGYTNPRDGTKLALPANYKYSYMSNHGDIIQTNDATFHPPADPGTSWDSMVKSK